MVGVSELAERVKDAVVGGETVYVDTDAVRLHPAEPCWTFLGQQSLTPKS